MKFKKNFNKIYITIIVLLVTTIVGLLFIRNEKQVVVEKVLKTSEEIEKNKQGSSSQESVAKKIEESKKETNVDKESISNKSTSRESDETLLNNLGSSTPKLKIEAANKIADRSDNYLVQALLAETSTVAERSIRLAMLKAIEKTDASMCSEALAGVIGFKKDGDIQKAAKKAIYRSSSRAAVMGLIEHAESNIEDQYLLRDVARTLSEFRRPKAVDSLAEGLMSENITIFVGSAAGLAKVGNQTAIDILNSYLGNTGNEQKEEIIEEALKRTKQRLH